MSVLFTLIRQAAEKLTTADILALLGIVPIEHGGTSADNADGAVANLIGGLTSDGAVDAAATSSIYAYYDNNKSSAKYVSGADLADKIIASGNFGALAFQGSVDLTTQVTGDLPFSNIAQIATAQFLGRNTSGTGDIEQLSMTTAKTMLGYEFGVAASETTISQSVSASSTYTQNIALNASDWTNGCMIVRDTTSGNYGTGALIHFGTSTSESSGVSGAITYIGASYSGTFQSRLNVGDGFVTAASFLGVGRGTVGEFRIDSVRISGTNLEVIWRNLAAGTRTITARQRYYLWRGDKDTTP